MKSLFAVVSLALLTSSAVAAPEIEWAASRAQFCMVYNKDASIKPVGEGSGFVYIETAWVFPTGEGQIHVFNGNGHSSDSPYMLHVPGSEFLQATDSEGYTWAMGTGEKAGYYTIQKGTMLTFFNCTKQVM